MIKTVSLMFATCSIGLCSGAEAVMPSWDMVKQAQSESIQGKTVHTVSKSRADIEIVHAGEYLASQVAQSRHDWKSASLFMEPILQQWVSDSDLLQRAMIVAMGAGEHARALGFAKQLKEQHPNTSNTIVDTFLIVDAFKRAQYEEAHTLYEKMDHDATIRFIGPFIEGWIAAALGKVNIADLNQNTVQLYHGILISDFLNDHAEIEKMIDKAMKAEVISDAEVEQIADLYGHVGLTDKALDLYETVLKNHPENETLQNKIDTLKKGSDDPLFKKIKTADQGMAQAFYDIARILYSERKDESARVFAHLSYYLAPDLPQTAFLLADINTRYKRWDAAVKLYKTIPEEDENYLQAQYNIVDIYDETEQFDKALALLNALSAKEEKPDTLIKIGDLYRHREQYNQALTLYDRAVDALGGTIPDSYWHLHYMRGMVYEQNGRWEEAEKELKAALAFRPDHPYILNYLGYSWVDRNMNLEKATDMIRQAVSARPNDGYITDSLGWAMYRTGDYKNAVKVLERAVELLPYDPTINDHLGDAYWKVGRTLEARFQWERAKNHSKDTAQVETILQKITSGLPDAI